MGKEEIVIVARNEQNGDVSVIRPNNDFRVEDFVISLLENGYFDLKICYLEELEL